MSITFRPAELSGVGLFLAIAGGSRTGKTYSALTLARGIAGPNGRIACVDTEGRRMSHYKADFLGEDGKPFDVFDMLPPFNGNRFVEACRVAQDAGYAVVVIDSFSLEWSGTGGVLAERERQFAAANYNAKVSDQIWNRIKGPGSEHKLMMDSFLQLTIPVIFCLRAHENAPHIGPGWKVDQDKRFLYEWTVGLTLHPDTPGMPRYDMADIKGKPLWKVQEQHKHLFPEGKLISREAGAALQAWRNTDSARTTTSVTRTETPPTPEEIAEGIQERFASTESHADHEAVLANDLVAKQVAWLQRKWPDLHHLVETARSESAFRNAPRASFAPAAKQPELVP